MGVDMKTSRIACIILLVVLALQPLFVVSRGAITTPTTTHENKITKKPDVYIAVSEIRELLETNPKEALKEIAKIGSLISDTKEAIKLISEIVNGYLWKPTFDTNGNKINDAIDYNASRGLIGDNDILDVIVIMKDPDEAQQTMREFELLGGKVIEYYDAVNHFHGYISYASLRVFAKNPNVVYIQPNFRIYPLSLYRSTQVMGARYAWDTLGYTGRGNISLVIMDTGLDPYHPMLKGYADAASNSSVWLDPNIKIVGWYDATSDNHATPWDAGSHGSHCAGISVGRWFNVTRTADGRIIYYIEGLGIDDEDNQYNFRPFFKFFKFYTYPGTVDVFVYWNVTTGSVTPQNLTVYDPSGNVVGYDTQIKTNGSYYYFHTSFSATQEGVYTVGFAHGVSGSGNGLDFWIRAYIPAPSNIDNNPLYGGVAPEAKLVGVKVFQDDGSGSMSDVDDGINWVISNKLTYHIVAVSMSFGTVGQDDTTNNLIQQLAFNGIVPVAAAGNDGPGQNTVSYSPGWSDYAITVAATNTGWHKLNITQYSSRGPGAHYYWLGIVERTVQGNTTKPDIAAPGGDSDDFPDSDEPIYSVDADCQENLDVATLSGGSISWSTHYYSETSDKGSVSGDMRGMEGTSMATPHVSGAVILLISALTGEDWDNWVYDYAHEKDIKRILLATAWEICDGDEGGSLDRGGKDPAEGYGFLQIDAAIEAVTMEYKMGSVETSELYPNEAQYLNMSYHHVWARKVWLEDGKTYRFKVDVPAGADFDLYIWYPEADDYGQPRLFAKSVNATAGTDEEVVFTANYTGWWLITVKCISGSGQFKFVGGEVASLGIYKQQISTNYPMKWYGLYIDTTATSILARIYTDSGPTPGNPTIELNDYSAVSLIASADNGGSGEPELLDYRSGASLGAITVAFGTDTSNLAGLYIDVCEIVGELQAAQNTSISVSSGVLVALSLPTKDGGQYRVRASGSGIDIQLEVIDSIGKTVGTSDVGGLGVEESVSFTASGTQYYVLIYPASGSGTVDVYFDDMGSPSISITSPQNGYNSSSTTVTITWTSSDVETSIAEHEIWVDGSLAYDNIPGTTTSYDISLTEGTHTVEVRAYDEGGNSASDSITITVDTTAPSVTITSPTDGSTVSTSDVTVEWTGDDGSGTGIEHYEVRCYNTTWDSGWINVGKSTSYTFTGLADGDYTVEVVAYDYAGNAGSDSVSFTVSTQQQGVSIESPTEDPSTGEAYVGSDDVALSWSPDPNADHYEIYVNGSLHGTTTGTNYEIENLGEGVWNITVVAVDAAGNTLSSDYKITVVDLTPPTVSPSRSMDVADSSTTSVTISWSGDDALSGIDHYEVYVDGSWVDVGNSTSYTIDTSSLSDGIYAVYIRAFDKTGHTAQSTMILIVDKVAPSLTIVYPSDGSVLASSAVVISWDASDALLGVEHFEVSTDGSTWISVGRETSYIWSGLTDGTYTFYVRAYDVAGNYVEVNVTFTIDLTAPDVTITSPADGSTVTTSDVTVQWQSSATDIAYYLVRLDSGAWINVGTSTSYTFSGVSDGVHVVCVVAVDNAGNSAMTTSVFIVEASATGSSVSSSLTQTTKALSALDEEISSSQSTISTSSVEVAEAVAEQPNTGDIAPKKNVIKITVVIVEDKAVSTEKAKENSNMVAPQISGYPHLRELMVATPIENSPRPTLPRWIAPAHIMSSSITRTLFLMYSIYLIRPPN